jgi:hypothetical protein
MEAGAGRSLAANAVDDVMRGHPGQLTRVLVAFVRRRLGLWIISSRD